MFQQQMSLSQKKLLPIKKRVIPFLLDCMNTLNRFANLQNYQKNIKNKMQRSISRIISLYIGCVKTTGGDADGACCSFPFRWKNKVYDDCKLSGDGQKSWCGTTYEPDKWGYCDDKAPSWREGKTVVSINYDPGKLLHIAIGESKYKANVC